MWYWMGLTSLLPIILILGPVLIIIIIMDSNGFGQKVIISRDYIYLSLVLDLL